ncbi:two-component response regulator involved in degradative enzyme [Bacillus sp. NRRL B-14911]|uniref:LuxR C-terminal-related transcriptional regulator n=1 Tax=Bacillus sp. NRRL B-14911 TaxID=313627 RepID=UPI00006B594A|nr:LuxR C-terminal-related transcriptional regulator [Bacillus sp. NRRL B-14911]EAR66211.1 two-component response regulator involved in degradative enzyme [Bacillus sp. NRRL B-14911]
MRKDMAMNILLIGDNTEHQTKFKGLLELAFPKALIVDGNLDSAYKLIHNYYDKWNLAIFLPLEFESEMNDLLAACAIVSLPVLCIVRKEARNIYGELLKKGVKGIVGYDSPLDILRNGIKFVKEGGMYFDAMIVKEYDIMPSFDKREMQQIPGLTRREWEIFQLTVKDMTNQEIAESLSINQSTVSVHIKGIVKKTGSKTIRGAVAKGLRYGWLQHI